MLFDEPKLIIEFDGSYWHDGTAEIDEAKSARLRDCGWAVVRVRESPLEVIEAKFDVVVPHRAPTVSAATVVLHHLAALGLCPRAAADAYKRAGVEQASDLAARWLAASREGSSSERR